MRSANRKHENRLFEYKPGSMESGGFSLGASIQFNFAWSDPMKRAA
jgi:hypothetical protein